MEEFVYYDPVRKIRFSFHPVTLDSKIEEENVDYEVNSCSHSVVQLRNDLVKLLDAYIQRQFRKGTTIYTVFVDEHSIKVEISCHNLNFKNFWGGEWLSTWVFDLSSNSASGNIKVHNHYFEQGNIQFNLSKTIPSTQIKGGLTAKSVSDFISRSETTVSPTCFL